MTTRGVADGRVAGAIAVLAIALLAGCSKKKSDDDTSTGDPTTTGSGGSGAAGSGGSGGTGASTAGTGGDMAAAGAAGSPEPAVCGDGSIDGDEECDGSELNHATCERLGLGPGVVGCKANCRFDLSGCAPGELCGNGELDGAEQCDDGDDNSNSEPNACRINCTLASCGDGVVDDDEGCDDGSANSNFRADACRSDCRPAYCGDGLIDSAEDCDSDKLGRATCAREGFSGGALACADTCTFDTSGCVTCGDGVADGKDSSDPGYEECDTDDYRGKDCTDFGFPGGRLGCSQCRIDTTRCGSEPVACGNDRIETGETCDGTDLDGRSCADFGFAGGRLACKSNCSDFDSSRCNSCGNGTIEGGEVCDDSNSEDDFTCSADCRSECGIGYGECDGDTSRYCGFDRSGKVTILTEYCDPTQGLSCIDGICQGSCAASSLGSSYLGCDYYPTVTKNQLVNTVAGDFAVAVANSGLTEANITVTMGDATVATDTAAPGDVAVIVLPWTSLRTVNTSLVIDGAYRLRTDQPVTVYQYNPLSYAKDGATSHTNDASLLLPTNTWTGNYVVVARNAWSSYPGFYSVVAKEDDTQVTLSPSASTSVVTIVPGIEADGSGFITLDQGDVLQVTAPATGGAPDPNDLTGTRIQASKPVQVIGGHDCTYVPHDFSACDHLEEAMMPIETLGSSYLVTPPLITATTEKARMVRVTAVEADTTVVYDPPQDGAPTVLANPGDYFEIATSTASFQIKANRRILVAEYMLGQSFGGATGDPAMVLAVPVEQYRAHYLFHAPTNYEVNYVNITAPSDATVTLDGTPLATGTPIGGTGYSVIRVPLDNSGNGNHVIEATARVGITVYGYGQYSSYWYPGGLELTQF